MKKIFKKIGLISLFIILMIISSGCGNKIVETTIFFETNGGSTVSPIVLREGSSIINPGEPVKTGHTFIGWFTDDETFINEFDFSYIPSDNLTVFAKWAINQYTIEFVSNEGAEVESLHINFGDEINLPNDPIKQNYIFAGWFLDDETFNHSANDLFSNPVCGNIVVFAKWEKEFYTVNFSLGGGEIISGNLIQIIEYGSPAVPPVIYRLGYDFIGWDGNLDSIDSDITLYPIWENQTFTYTFDQGKITITGLKEGFNNNALEVPEKIYHLGNDRDVVAIIEEAFMGKNFITSVHIPASISSIGRGILKGCLEIVEIEVPLVFPYNENTHSYIRYYFGGESHDDYSANVNYSQKIISISISEGSVGIGEYAFTNFNLPNLKDIFLPDSLIEIGSNAFENCIYIENIHIGTGLKTLGEFAFYGCESLKNVNFPDGLLRVEKSAFALAISIESVVLPNSVIYIGSNAFENCINLKSINIPEGVEEIKNYTFYNCYKLEEVSISSNIETIGTHSFYNCYLLETISFPNSLTQIGAWAFYNCENLAELNIPPLVEEIGHNAFNGFLGLVKFHENSIISRIDNNVFRNYKGSSLIIPESVLQIGNNAFQNCDNLLSIEIPANVISIGTYAFSGATGEITFAEGSQITSIGSNAFRDFKGTKIEIPQTVTTLENYAFSGCSNLLSFTIHADLVSIGEYVFNGVPGVVEFDSEWNGTTLGNRVFRGYKGDSLTLPDTITSMGDEVFRDCTLLESIHLPQNLVSLGFGTFENCESLKNIVIPNGITEIKLKTFDGCVELENVTLPNNLTIIGTSAFRNCSKLNYIEIPETVGLIMDWAFEGCSGLEAITIPASISNIQSSVFKDCENLKNLTILAEWPPIFGNNALLNTHSDLKIYVFPDNVLDYKNSPYWSIYGNIIFAIE